MIGGSSLQAIVNHDGIHKLLRDQYFGETELSICRVAVKPGEFYTQASVIFSTQDVRDDNRFFRCKDKAHGDTGN